MRLALLLYFFALSVDNSMVESKEEASILGKSFLQRPCVRGKDRYDELDIPLFSFPIIFIYRTIESLEMNLN